MNILKNIFSYESYRKYLQDYYFFQKKTNSGFTYASFAVVAKLNSPNYFKLVSDGKRNLTVANVQQFGKALNLTFQELVYFEALVLREQSSSVEERTYYSKRISDLRKVNKTNGAKIKRKEFISHWYTPAILACLQRRPETFDLTEASKLIGISKIEIEKDIEILKAKGILRIEKGFFQVESNHLTYHDPKLTNVIQKTYLKDQLDRSTIAFNKKYDKGAKFYAHTFTLPAQDLPYYQSQLNHLIDGIIAKADEGPPEKLAQLNIQFFPLSD